MKHPNARRQAAPIEAEYGRLLSAQDVATRIGLPVRVIYRMASHRQITALRPSGRLLGIYEADLRDWVRRHRVLEETPTESGAHRPSMAVDEYVRSLLKPTTPHFRM